jgi:hypothetical protein
LLQKHLPPLLLPPLPHLLLRLASARPSPTLPHHFSFPSCVAYNIMLLHPSCPLNCTYNAPSNMCTIPPPNVHTMPLQRALKTHSSGVWQPKSLQWDNLQGPSIIFFFSECLTFSCTLKSLQNSASCATCLSSFPSSGHHTARKSGGCAQICDLADHDSPLRADAQWAAQDEECAHKPLSNMRTMPLTGNLTHP